MVNASKNFVNVTLRLRRMVANVLLLIGIILISLTVLSSNKGLANASLFEPVRVMCEINGFRVPAIIDTGAEVTVMSTSCAKRCHLLNQIDTKHCGKAVGVGSGSSEIVGGIDKLGLRIGPLNFQSKISVMRNSRCDLLLGLDVLRRFDCEVSLKTRRLRLFVRGEKVSVPFMKNEFEDHGEYQLKELSSLHPSIPPRHLQPDLDSQAQNDGDYYEEEDYLSMEEMNISMEGV